MCASWGAGTEAGCLTCGAHRYNEDDIYTFAGPVLIALNPCKPLQLYTPEVANMYKGAFRLGSGQGQGAAWGGKVWNV